MPFSSEPQPLVGRDEELTRIRSFFRDAVVSGGALLLYGDPGVGKSALLGALAESAAAEGTRVLTASGVEFEADVGYSGLNQLLLPLHDAFDRLEPVHRDALRLALGFDSGPPPDRLLVSNAALLLVRRIAADTPLLLIVDDLPWIDRASAAVLGFVARRLVGSRVGFLGASRSHAGSFFERGGLPEFELRPLPPGAADELVRSRFPTLAPTERRRLIAEADGNPLALLELAVARTRSHDPAPAALPLTGRLRSLYASRVTDLPPRCRRLLLLGALDGTGDLGVLLAAAGAEYTLADLEPAERDRLARVDEHTRRLAFGHPLIRAAVVETASSAERRWAHHVLAETLTANPERRAWHLGEATAEPDAEVADLLEETAHRRLQRGDAVGAIASLTRAAELSPVLADRTRRLAKAAYIGADSSGELTNASQLLEDLRRVDPHSTDSLHAAAASAFLLINRDGDVDTAHRLLVTAIESGRHDYRADDDALCEALYTLMLLCWFGGRAELWEPYFAALEKMTPEPPDVLWLSGRLFADPRRIDAEAADRLDAALSTLHDETDPTTIVRLATASVYLDRLGDIREAIWRVVRMGRDGTGPARRHIAALLHLCLDGYLTGRWDEAQQLAEEGLWLCAEHDYRFFTWYFRYNLALIAAGKGDQATMRAHTDELLRFAAARQALTPAQFAHHARLLANLGLGDYDAASQDAAEITPLDTLAPFAQKAVWAAMDVAEAAVYAKRHAEAVKFVAELRATRLFEHSSRQALLLAGAEALVADGDRFEAAFEAALALPGAERWPFELARVRLAYGERLRRVRATARSREQLRAALEAFERLGARPWAERAGNELRATGLTKPRNAAKRPGTLTAQEREIAELAGSGLTNKQIAERLFLSHRTVGAHLYQIFPKLGITSRAALRDALATLPDQPEDD